MRHLFSFHSTPPTADITNSLDPSDKPLWIAIVVVVVVVVVEVVVNSGKSRIRAMIGMVMSETVVMMILLKVEVMMTIR